MERCASRFRCYSLAGLVLVGCSAPESEENVGVIEQSFATVSPIKSATVPGLLRWPDTWAGSYIDAAAASSPGNLNRFVVAYRGGSPNYTMGYLVTDGSSTGNLLLGPTNTNCGGSPCSGYDIRADAWTSPSGHTYPLFAHGFWETGPFPYGYVKLNVMRVLPWGSYSQTTTTVRSCASPFGYIYCRMFPWDIATRKRSDELRNTALVAYFLTGNTSAVIMTASLVTPPAQVTHLASVQPCQNPPCAYGGGGQRPAIAVAYNEQADKYLVVGRTYGIPAARVTGQIYDAVTGVPGPTIDMGSPPSFTAEPGIGIASNPDPAVNPNQEWVVFLHDDTRYWVRPDGTFTSGSIAPAGLGVGNDTLHYTLSSTDSYEYERLFDFNQQTADIYSQRFTHVAGNGQTFALQNVPAFAEALAHGNNQVAIALWSGQNCNFFGCTEVLRWRLIDH